MTADHLLHYKPGAEGYGTWRLECVPGFDHGSYSEQTWPDDTMCRCLSPECPCREGDHGGCTEFGNYIGDIGQECRCAFDPAECWTTSWFDELGSEALHGDDWPEDVLPLPVTCTYDDALVVRYAPPGPAVADTGTAIEGVAIRMLPDATWSRPDETLRYGPI